VSLLDPPKASLSFHLWDENNLLKPVAKEYILETLYNLIPEEYVHKVFLLGSMAGLQYKDTSDIDINVYLQPSQDRELWHKNFKLTARGLPYMTTKHTLNFFPLAYKPKPSYRGARNGVYNISDSRWDKYPKTLDEIRDPEEQFKLELALASQVSGFIQTHTKHLLENIKGLDKLKKEDIAEYKSRRAAIEEDIMEMLRYWTSLDDERKDVYESRWGIPRESYQNIMYKAVEHGQLGDILHTIENQFKD
jgi:hypothetical protein